MALELLIDAVDRISLLQAGSMVIIQTREGLNSTCAFDLLDQDVWVRDAWTVEETRVEDGDVITTHLDWGDDKPKVDVKVCDGATTYFAGTLSRMTVTQMGCEAQIVHCSCHDYNQVLEESVVDTLETYTVEDDEDIIDDIFTNYVTGINFADFVATVGTIDEANFDGITVRRVLDILASQTGAVWYVDYDKKLHYNAAGAAAPAWHLSDSPDDINSFSYFDDIARARDVTNMVNRVFVIGEAASTWYGDAASMDEWGTHQAIIRDQTLVETDDMAARADAILDKFKDPIDVYTLSTYQDGLRAGMSVRVVCAFYNVDDTFLIAQLVITFPPDKDPVYKITCGGTTGAVGASVHRLALDATQDWQGYIPPGTHLSSLGWAHDLGFTSTDVDTVSWTIGQIIAANGTTFNILAGNTGNLGAGITYVYLDTAISAVVLQTTQVMASTVGYNRIPVAVCWPSDGVGAETAGFMVFKGGDEMPLILCATNIAADAVRTVHLVADCVTATEVNIGTLSAISADMGTLTAGTIQTAAAGNPRVVINIADGIRGIDALNVTQFQLTPVTGKAYFGGNAGIMDEDGLRFLGAGATGDTRRIRFMYNDAGTERRMGRVFADWGGGAGLNTMWVQAWRQAGAPWPVNATVILAAIDQIAGTDVRFHVGSSGTINATGCTLFMIEDYLRVEKGLFVGSLAGNADDNDVWCQGEISTDGGTVKWNLGGVNTGTITPDRKIAVEINGSWYTIAAQNGLV